MSTKGSQDQMTEELRRKEAANMTAFLNTSVESVLRDQRGKAKWCFERSYHNLDTFMECYTPFHQYINQRLPIYEAGLNWASTQFNKCIKDSKVPHECYDKFKRDVEHFTDFGKITSH